MQRYTLRAARQPDGRYRVAIDPAHPDVSSDHRYAREEVEGLASTLAAELRWVEAPTGMRRAPDVAGGRPAPDNTDPWCGELAPGDED